jgi:hypothetical protein
MGNLGASLCALALVGCWFAITTGNATTATAGVVFAGAGVLFVLGSRRDAVAVGTRRVDWRQLNGAGTILLAVAWLVGVAPFVASSAFGAVVLVGALSLGFLGSQELLGRQPGFDASPSRARLIAVSVLVALSVAGGAVLASTIF